MAATAWIADEDGANVHSRLKQQLTFRTRTFKSLLFKRPGVEQAMGQGGRMPPDFDAMGQD